jgi:hypothetical protein
MSPTETVPSVPSLRSGLRTSFRVTSLEPFFSLLGISEIRIIIAADNQTTLIIEATKISAVWKSAAIPAYAST